MAGGREGVVCALANTVSGFRPCQPWEGESERERGKEGREKRGRGVSEGGRHRQWWLGKVEGRERKGKWRKGKQEGRESERLATEREGREGKGERRESK